jgi:CBS domain containing-hemolysin-like protein
MPLAVNVTPAVSVGILVVLLLTSAFFSSAEIAVFSLDDLRLASLTEGADATTNARAETLATLRSNPHRLLVTILVGNNVVNVAVASITTGLLVDLLPAGSAITVSTLLVSVAVLVFGEITPKSYGVANAESWALRTARPLAAIQRVASPVVAVFDLLTRAVGRLTGGSTDYARPELTREEVSALVRSAERAGVIDADERAMIQSVFRFSTTTAREVMVPRVEMVAASVESTPEAIVSLCLDERVTRVPVYEESVDRVVGYVDVRDAVRAVREGAPASLSDLLRPVLYVFEGREIDEILADLQDERLELAVVLDEFGTTEGMLTVEDVVEEVVGDLFDADDERSVIVLTERSATARGEAKLRDVERLLGVDLPDAAGGDTVAALVLDELGHVPSPGETVTVDGVRLTVGAVERNRVLRVRVDRLDHLDAAEMPDG